MPGWERSRHQKLQRARSVKTATDFKFQVRTFTRPSIVAEGDSWFEYPGTGKSNVIDHVQSWTRGRANLFRLGSNGDEATEMLSASQRHKLSEILRETNEMGRPVDLLLFSAGGNDVVGAWDLERFVKKPYPAGEPVERWFHKRRLDQKVEQVELAYRELMTLRNHYSPSTQIVAHTYDRPIPSDVGFRIPIFGKVTGPWIKPALDAAGVPAGPKQRQAARYLIERLRDALVPLERAAEARGRFHVVDTHGSVPTSEWRDEIHPTSKGFEKVAARIYARMRQVVPALPAR